MRLSAEHSWLPRKRKKKAQQMSMPYRVPASIREKAETEDRPERKATGAYRAPRGRGGTTMDDNDVPSLQLNNLPQETTDEDLRELCKPFGNLRRLFLAKDKRTGDAKGFAYIDFEFRDDAEKALQSLNGHRYGYTVLSCEWAKPRQK